MRMIKQTIYTLFTQLTYQVRYPVKTIVDQPKPIELEKITPINVDKPLKYIEKVNVPVDGKGSESNLSNNVNPDGANGLQDLSAGYASTKKSKAQIICGFDMFICHFQALPLGCSFECIFTTPTKNT